MPDSKGKRGKADRMRAARLEKYEVYYIAHKFGLTMKRVRDVIRRVGNMRSKVYAAIEKI